MTSPDPGLELAHRIASAVTWAQIGARDGKPGKIAKRDAKRLAKKASAAARLKANATRGVVLRFRPMSGHEISVRGIWCGDGTADVRIECGCCDWFADLRYPATLEHVTALGNGHLMMAAADAGREAVLREAAITADGWCAAHHCFRPECSERTHVHTVRLLDAEWERVAAKAAAKGMDTNAGVIAALRAWAAGDS